jgi:antibiotic biosynthesis monooxygenase (ABM) superfamily enzyme
VALLTWVVMPAITWALRKWLQSEKLETPKSNKHDHLNHN